MISTILKEVETRDLTREEAIELLGTDEDRSGHPASYEAGQIDEHP